MRNHVDVGLSHQLRRAFAICKKDIRIYYLKAPVIVMGILFPTFMFAAFLIGRDLDVNFLMSNLTVVTVFFTSTAVTPIVMPWETRSKTLERLISCPVSVSTIIFGDILASFIFGIVFSLVPLIIGLNLGVKVLYPLTFLSGIVLASFCFSSLAAIFSTPPTDIPANAMMLSTLIRFPLLFISGVFIPIENLPSWGVTVASVSPLTYFTDLTIYSITGASHYHVSLDFTILAGFTIFFLWVSVKLHERNMSKRM
ncbi:MAG: ABC transporter permease [Candidatus Bathyarchaeia archaeon]|nr:ABC transporter permease [Candidatus Bathyarchaeota archaeon]